MLLQIQFLSTKEIEDLQNQGSEFLQVFNTATIV